MLDQVSCNHALPLNCFSQTRKGAGPLLHAAAATIERSIRIQEKLSFPLGRVLLRTGSRIPQAARASKDIIIDPFKAFGKEFVGRYMIQTLPFWERILLKGKYDPDLTAEIAFAAAKAATKTL